ELRPRARDFVDQQVGAGAVLDDILVVAGVAGEHGGPAAVLEAIAVARLDDVALVDLESDHLYAILLVDDAVAVELGDVRRDPRARQLFVGDANLDVECVRLLEILHQLARASWSDHAVRRLAGAEM